MAGRIHMGVGGWTYEDWRNGVFYPADLPQKRELEWASRALTSIEINGTYYRSQSPASFRKWHDETPEGFVFALKGPRFTTNRKILAEAGESVERFVTGGILELGDKLGPINWQLMGTKRLDPEDFAAFLALLPHEVDGRTLRHAVEVRHQTFAVPEAVELARAHGVALVLAGDSAYPAIPDPTADFVYARIMGTTEGEPKGYSDAALDLWATRARQLAAGEAPEGLAAIAGTGADGAPRDVYLYVISGHKALNPSAAQALIARLED